jgi:hypothetical protein
VLACSTEQKKYDHEIGHIDPASALGPKDFRACDSLNIFQYYNSFPHAGYKFGKKALRAIVKEKYQPVSDNSGYLTIRFIINCNGSAGRFNIHENDLNLMPSKFDDKIKDQLYNIVSENLIEWQPLYFDGVARDSYMYLTFKIQNGEILDILP